MDALYAGTYAVHRMEQRAGHRARLRAKALTYYNYYTCIHVYISFIFYNVIYNSIYHTIHKIYLYFIANSIYYIFFVSI